MPFPGGLEATANGTLLFSIIAALVYLLIVKRPPSWRRTVVKALSTALLALLAAIEGGPALLVLALALGSLGDAFLANDGERAFLGGLTSFLAAHLAYVWLFWSAGYGAETLGAEIWRLAGTVLILGLAAVMMYMLLPTVGGDLRIPVGVYVGAIVLMGLTALTLDKPMVILGAAMFMASDTILASEKFLLAERSPHRRWTPYAVWTLYYAGQAAIALGFLS
ncbi:MAG: lysoplasmalogenase [Rhizobiaceae bacterium]